MEKKNEKVCSIVVVGRDKYSPTGKCLSSVLENSPEAFEFITVLGGAPQSVQNQLSQRFPQVQFIFKPEFLNPAQARNIGLQAAQGRLTVLMDNDVVVRPDWLRWLVDCQQETGAAMVVPIVLEEENIIHTAANSFYITHDQGKAYGHKELHFHGKILNDDTNLKRQPTEYGELHCQLVERETAIRLGAFDENIQEVGECDSGLTWKRAGCPMYFEPRSIVDYMLYHPIRPEDIRFFIWRWDMRAILKGYRYFEKKWGIDITEHGSFRDFLLHYNRKVGFWSRVFPSRLTLILDRVFYRLGRLPEQLSTVLLSPWRNFLRKRLGYFDWVEYNQQ